MTKNFRIARKYLTVDKILGISPRIFLLKKLKVVHSRFLSLFWYNKSISIFHFLEFPQNVILR